MHVAAGRLDDAALAELPAAEPDVVLLVGGTDGGEASVLRFNASVLAAADWSVPVVLAGNAAVRDEVAGVLRGGGLPVTEADNVLPDIGRLAPESARAAIREVFLEHVIGGDRLSTDPRLRSWVRAVTPDAVLEGVAVLARVLAADEMLRRRPRRGRGDDRRLLRARPRRRAGHAGPRGGRHPGPTAHGRGDLGVSWSVDALRAAAAAEGLPVAGRGPPGARRSRGHGRAAPAPAGRGRLRAGGASARSAGLVVLSGGVFRHGDPAGVQELLARLAEDTGGAGSVVDGRPVVVDRDYVLAAVGLLAAEHPAAAAAWPEDWSARPLRPLNVAAQGSEAAAVNGATSAAARSIAA